MSPSEIVARIKNAVFPSKEGDGIEHVDMSYGEFMSLIDTLASFGLNAEAAKEPGKPRGAATVMAEEPMIEQFPAHQEDL